MRYVTFALLFLTCAGLAFLFFNNKKQKCSFLANVATQSEF